MAKPRNLVIYALESEGKTKISKVSGGNHSPDIIHFNFFVNTIWYFIIISNNFNFSAYQNISFSFLCYSSAIHCVYDA
jgi:hypothetical protein